MDITPFKANRARLLEALPPASAALVFSGREQFRNRDVDYPFRVHSDFYYLTGFSEPDSTLLLIHAEDGSTHSVAFVRPRDEKAEIWTGRRLGVERAPDVLGVDAAYSGEEWDAQLVELLKGVQQVHVSFSDSAYWWPVLQPVFAGLKKHIREGVEPPQALQDLDRILHEQRLIKQPWELAHLREAAQISVKGHLAAMQAAPRVQTEREVQRALECAFYEAGGDDLSFNPIVASGANACVLHYTENGAPLDRNALLLVDAGAEKAFYAGDITTTFPASGRFSAEQKALYEVVLAAQHAALAQVRPGIPYDRHHQAAVRVLTEGLVDLGLLQGEVDTLIEEKAYTRFYMHKTGHWLGLDVHDVGAYRLNGAWRPLEENMVLTVEPGLYVAPDDDTVEAHWRGIGIRIEDDVRVIAEGYEILTHGLPRTPEEIEAWMS
ncbi:aminopeptidase P Metallo peptidase. MEROPS family M24B [Sulfurivirga caldicuralii]|uniref:Xaa-Pro aminopeptidase n=1 Tax=Sulfurivirga caldicuralii TaxID=364032 RepID=A0A1N6EPE4_9GAMM|nr:aminopeptidase P N-terminal domain-containing protein [Sulfurivirga caldicuralii]SIN84874.1 aminopeptidase P Metallo peptidase. MEROPS family M24B [Sulfurivirga caldicuralii]